MTPADRHNGQPFGAGLAHPEATGSVATPAQDDRPPFDGEAPAEVEPWYPDPAEDAAPRLTLAEFIKREATAYRARGTTAGEFIAARLDQLAQEVGWTHAATPEEHDARIATWDREEREHWRASGFEEGHRAGCQCGGQEGA